MDKSFSSMNEDGQLKIRENLLTDLIARLNFTQAAFYTWTGKFPTEQEEALFNACLISVIDHGPDALTAQTARSAASGGAEMHAAIAAGILAAGKHHGTTPLQKATIMIREAVQSKASAQDIVKTYAEDGKRIPGYGHKVYETDPRTTTLLLKAEELGFVDEHVKLAREIEKELEKQKGKKLCLNVDGAIASLMPGLGIGPEQAPGIFLLGRMVGLVMHVGEEQAENPARLRPAKK